MTKKRSSAKSLINNILSGAAEKGPDKKESKPTIGGKSIISHREERAHSHTRDEKKTKVLMTMKVDPALCRIQQRPNRIYELLTVDNCLELIESIETQGQQIPAIARQTDEKEYPYEIIVGRRRHFAATHLKTELLVDVRVLTDESAFLLSEAENEGRKDLSDYEKALDWADALDSFYNGKVDRLAVAINKSRAVVYDYLELAKLDGEIINAFASVLDIKKDHAKQLKFLMKKVGVKEKIFAKAKELASDNVERSGSDTLKLLVAAAKTGKKKGGLLLDETIVDKNGNSAFKITRTSKGGYTIKFDSKLKSDKGEIKTLLAQAVDEFMFKPK
jgi:ParB family chromosome partitioning protein